MYGYWTYVIHYIVIGMQMWMLLATYILYKISLSFLGYYKFVSIII